jgi:hypothetical protein
MLVPVTIGLNWKRGCYFISKVVIVSLRSSRSSRSLSSASWSNCIAYCAREQRGTHFISIAKYNKILNQSASEELYIHLWNYTKLC